MDTLFGPPILEGRFGQVVFAMRPNGTYPALGAFQSPEVSQEERDLACVYLNLLVSAGEIVNSDRYFQLEDDLHALHCGCLRLGIRACPKCWIVLAWFRSQKILWTPAEIMLIRR